MDDFSRFIQGLSEAKDKQYTIYYDESNNVRKLTLSPEIDGYNVEHDPENYTGINFLLGGVAHAGDTSSADVALLKKMIALPPSAKEIKLRHIASNDFIGMLNSSKLTAFLEWLKDTDLCLHYFNLNMEYWSYLDIIEDCIEFGKSIGKLAFQSFQSERYYQHIQKGTLYKAISSEKVNFIQMLKDFDYPYISGYEKAFLSNIATLAYNYHSKVRSNPFSTYIEKFEAEKLCRLMDVCICYGMDDMTMTMDVRRNDDDAGNDNYLVDGFSVFYRKRAEDFSSSKHIFDVEDVIRDKFEQERQSNPKLSKLSIDFSVSHDNEMIQISDVIAGLFQRYFKYLNLNKIDDIIHVRRNLNRIQQRNINLLQEAVNKTDRECRNLLFYVMPSGEHDKHMAFMYPENRKELMDRLHKEHLDAFIFTVPEQMY